MIHSPFLYNLYKCCNENYEDFSFFIDEVVRNRIADLCKEVCMVLEEKMGDENDRSILTSKFCKFVNEMENWDKDVLPNYCLFNFYLHISQLVQHFEVHQNSYNAISKDDMDVIKKFEKLYMEFEETKDAHAILGRRLKELFEGIRNRKDLKRIKEELFEFLLKEVFPRYYNSRGELLDFIKRKDWNDIVFGNTADHKFIKKSLGDSKDYKRVRSLFLQLCRLQKNDIAGKRKILIDLSETLDKIYNLNCFSCDKNPEKKPEKDIREKDSELHSHIIMFMRWIPIISEGIDGEKLMEAVDDIISQIRDQINEMIDNDIDLEEKLKIYPENYYDDIFLQENNISLRILLIGAMCKEPYIQSQFQLFYKSDTSHTEMEGYDE